MDCLISKGVTFKFTLARNQESMFAQASGWISIKFQLLCAASQQVDQVSFSFAILTMGTISVILIPIWIISRGTD